MVVVHLCEFKPATATTQVFRLSPPGQQPVACREGCLAQVAAVTGLSRRCQPLRACPLAASTIHGGGNLAVRAAF